MGPAVLPIRESCIRLDTDDLRAAQALSERQFGWRHRLEAHRLIRELAVTRSSADWTQEEELL